MIRPALVFVMSAMAVSATAQDLTISFKSSEGGAATHFYSKDRARFQNGRSDTMIDFASGKIVTIDHQKKEYSEITLEEMEQTMKAASAQMEEMMAKIPPQMREQMAGRFGGGDVSVTKGESRTVAGYSCTNYTISMGTMMTQETCNTTALTPPFDPSNFQKLSKVSVPMMQGMDKVIAKMSEVKGLSLSQRTSVKMMGQGRDTTLEATEVKKGPIAASAFELPAGYKQVESPLKKMGKMGPR